MTLALILVILSTLVVNREILVLIYITSTNLNIDIEPKL